MIDLAELQVKHAKTHIDLVKSALERLRAVDAPSSDTSSSTMTNKAVPSVPTNTERLSTTTTGPAELPTQFHHEPMPLASAFT
ncbi:unnamed protein product [Echinostoma caproni]|uniref:Uncharacterized protein n=1 Tax=Echinostoma caproni TaxID=27848 RepID=A0A3P8L3S5_9TREM|nr:unnamed protein product [Echinostoma caproni]